MATDLSKHTLAECCCKLEESTLGRDLSKYVTCQERARTILGRVHVGCDTCDQPPITVEVRVHLTISEAMKHQAHSKSL